MNHNYSDLCPSCLSVDVQVELEQKDGMKGIHLRTEAINIM